MFSGIGVPELLIILAIALVIFGANKVPNIARSLGRGIREFQEAKDELNQEIHAAKEIEELPAEGEDKDEGEGETGQKAKQEQAQGQGQEQKEAGD
ncbi:MAG: twin-arginine translocase TatA/TatE family subunit [Candidatus Bipolaricaulia bacterium]